MTLISRQFLVFTFFSLLFLAGVTSIQQKLIPTDSGIYGVATIGPTCPVMKVGDNSCADRPYQTSLAVYTYDSNKPTISIYPPVYGIGRKVTTFTTDLAGKFRVTLAPGEYVIRKDGSATPPALYDQKVTVQGHVFTQINITFDSGIR